MGVPFRQPDYTSDSGSVYPTNIDNAVSAMARGHGSAFKVQAEATPSMTVDVLAGAVFDGTTLTEKAATTIGPITAPVTNPRIDRIVVDRATGVPARVAGTESATPSAPAVPAGKAPLARIDLTTGQTEITDADISDERALSLLGAGTAASRNTGTSGDNVPLLSGANTWNQQQTFSHSNLIRQASGDTASHTMNFDFVNGSGTRVGNIFATGDPGGSTIIRYLTLGLHQFHTGEVGTIAGTPKMSVNDGLYMKGASGGDQGDGTINATAFYKNGVALGGLEDGTQLVQDPFTINTSTTQAHSLGGAPDFVTVHLQCKTAEGNWSVNDLVFVGFAFAGSNAGFLVVGFDSANITAYVVNATFSIVNKTGYGQTSITPANWKLIVTPWKAG